MTSRCEQRKQMYARMTPIRSHAATEAANQIGSAAAVTKVLLYLAGNVVRPVKTAIAIKRKGMRREATKKSVRNASTKGDRRGLEALRSEDFISHAFMPASGEK